MPWYWSDDIAATLLSRGKIDIEDAASLIASPVAFRRDGDGVEAVADELAEEGEIPLAA